MSASPAVATIWTAPFGIRTSSGLSSTCFGGAAARAVTLTTKISDGTRKANSGRIEVNTEAKTLKLKTEKKNAVYGDETDFEAAVDAGPLDFPPRLVTASHAARTFSRPAGAIKGFLSVGRRGICRDWIEHQTVTSDCGSYFFRWITCPCGTTGQERPLASSAEPGQVTLSRPGFEWSTRPGRSAHQPRADQNSSGGGRQASPGPHGMAYNP